ncbi:hypothetical protein N7471_010563 [Penicillium samsonianum]|uniref:uncharacterized protein n=1 Tax=Penicillium samsonianum TaxID=1882272 RepID=UPI00254805C0|nr:uncharacterized protein N7471_010563 [Penicillium samsonianum]KAJ6126070.1 hypothetical protein N7471_010563 [Penicillium samsonianum]
MTIIDSSLASTLQLQFHKTADIPVAGIGSNHISSTYINLPIFFFGDHNVARLNAEAHVVDNLAAKLLLGMDVMAHEGFRLDLDTRTVRIASCMGFTFSANVHSRLHHQDCRSVKAAVHTILPPRSTTPVQTLTATLPADRDYIFQGQHPHASFYSHIVDANMSWVLAVNDTNTSIQVPKGSTIGTLTEVDQQPQTAAYAVSPHGAELGRSVPTKPIYYDGLKHAQHENVLPNGITIFACKSMVNKLADVVNVYDVWGQAMTQAW